MAKTNSLATSTRTLKGQIYKHRKILSAGTVLYLDPSCVSSSSKPGYAIFKVGNFIEQGIFDITYHVDLSVRLRRIRLLIETELRDNIDAVVIEKIPPKPIYSKKQASAKGRAWLNLKSHGSLMQAIGAMKCSFNEKTPIIELPASIWHIYANRYGWNITKEDDEDAYIMGLTINTILSEMEV